MNKETLKIKKRGEDGNKIISVRIKEDILSEDVYNTVEFIVIKTEEILKDFRALVDYTGFCCYDDITEVGKWKFDEKKQTFVKVK